jgi:hypothetical protein
VALITNLAPNKTPSPLLDAEGRAIEHMSSELGRSLLRLDMLLRDAEMKFNIECPECSQRMGRPVYVMPVERVGRVEFVCPHVRRISELSAL